MPDQGGDQPPRGAVSLIARDAVIYGVGGIAGQAVAFLLLPFYTKYLSPTDYGVQEIIGLGSGLIGIVLGAGLVQALSRFYFRTADPSERKDVVGTLIVIVAVIGALGSLSLSMFADPIAGALLGDVAHADIIVLALWSLSVGLIADVWLAYLRVLGRAYSYVATSLISMVVVIALNVWLLAFVGLGLKGIFLAGLIGRVGLAAALSVLLWRDIGLRINGHIARRMLQFSLPLVPSRLASVVTSYSDRFFLAHWASLADVGLYALSQRLASPLQLLLSGPFFSAFEPRRFEVAERDEGPRVLADVFLYFAVGVAVAVVFISVVAEDVIRLMTAEEFHQAAKYVPLAVVGAGAYVIRQYFDFGILYSGKTHLAMWGSGLTAVTQVSLNIALISRFGAYGALWAGLLANTIGLLYFYHQSQRLYRMPIDQARISRLLIISVTAVTVAFFVSGPSAGMTFVLKALVLGGFLAALVIAGVVPRKAVRRAVREMLMRSRR